MIIIVVNLIAALIWVDKDNNSNDDNHNNDDYDNTDDNHTERRNLRFLQSPHCATSCFQHKCSSGQGAIVCKSCAVYRTLIMCNMFTIWYKRTASLLSLTEFKSHLFIG